jgi:hypothetical protein
VDQTRDDGLDDLQYGLTLYLAYESRANISSELIELIDREMLPALCAEKHRYVATLWGKQNQIRPLFDSKRVDGKQVGSLTKFIAGQDTVSQAAGISGMRLDGVPSGNTDISKREWLLDISPPWTTGHNDPMPAHFSLFVSYDVIRRDRAFRQYALKIVRVAEEGGVIRSGFCGVYPVLLNSYGDYYTRTMHADVDAAAHVSKAMWSMVCKRREVDAIWKYGWLLYLGRDMSQKVNIKDVAPELDAESDMPGAWSCSTYGGGTIIGMGKHPLGHISDIFGSYGQSGTNVIAKLYDASIVCLDF